MGVWNLATKNIKAKVKRFNGKIYMDEAKEVYVCLKCSIERRGDMKMTEENIWI